jgi:osmotically-inducible protein OsmY
MKHVREQRGVADFRVEREGSTAILYGTAPSEEEVDLLARTIRLEPGVYEVESRMQVQSPAEEF